MLVVGDDPATLRYVRGALAGAGYAVVVTSDPADLPRILAAERPDLVLLDLVLPGADGIELLARVPGLARRPVVFISAYRRGETVAQALEAGAVDYIAKLADRAGGAGAGRAPTPRRSPSRLGSRSSPSTTTSGG